MIVITIKIIIIIIMSLWIICDILCELNKMYFYTGSVSLIYVFESECSINIYVFVFRLYNKYYTML